MKDAFGTELAVGDEVAYVSRQGSSTSLRKMMVVEVGPTHIRACETPGSPTMAGDVRTYMTPHLLVRVG